MISELHVIMGSDFVIEVLLGIIATNDKLYVEYMNNWKDNIFDCSDKYDYSEQKVELNHLINMYRETSSNEVVREINYGEIDYSELRDAMLRKIRIFLAALFFLAVTALFVDSTGTVQEWLGWTAKVQFLPALLAMNVDTFVEGYSVEPCREFRVASERVDVLPCLEEYVLKHVVGVFVYENNTSYLPIQLFAVLGHHLLECPASCRGIHQTFFQFFFVFFLK